jgi:predicted protein tyrosine phosphatase
MLLTELPLGLPGRIFRSSMPFSQYDPQGDALREFHTNKIALIVLLAEAEECIARASRDLRAFYLREGFQVLPLPIVDFGVPTKDTLEEAITKVVGYAQAGRHIAVHCHAGIGRTGLFAASLAKRVLGLSGEQAIEWVRRYIPEAVENAAQRQLVMGDGA